MKSEHGTTIFELLISLLLFSLLASIAATTLQSSQRFAAIRTRVQARDAFAGVVESIDRGAQRARALSGIQTIKFHPPGTLRDSRGESIAPSRTTGIAPGSGAVSFLRLNPGAILHRAASGSRRDLIFCSFQRVALSKTNESGLWLAIAPEWYAEAAARAELIGKTDACKPGFAYRIPLRPAIHPVFSGSVFSGGAASSNDNADPTSLELRNTLTVVEVEESVSLYRANNDSLRRVAHQTGDNQPLLYGVAAFQVTPQLSSRAFTVAVQFTASKVVHSHAFPLWPAENIHPLDLAF